MSLTGFLPQMKNLVPSTEWQQTIIGAKEIVVTLFDTILQVAVGTSLVRRLLLCATSWPVPPSRVRPLPDALLLRSPP